MMESHKRKIINLIDLEKEASFDDDVLIVESDSKKIKKDSESLSVCKYGLECYRKNPEHFLEFSHPTDHENKRKETLEPRKNFETFVLNYSNPFYFSKLSGIDKSVKMDVNSINLNEILSIDKDKFVKSSQFNFVIDPQWLLKQYPFENRQKPLLIVCGDKDTKSLNFMEVTKLHSNIKFAGAKIEVPFGTHHTKMMLLVYNNGMRVVIHTANLIEQDWLKRTQGIWISDLFPLINKSKSLSKNNDRYDSKTNFKKYLIMYLEHYENNSLREWTELIKLHDMTSANVFLIGSVSGRYPSTKKLFGHLRLRKILSDYFQKRSDPSSTDEFDDNLVCQFSSIGSLGPNEKSWLCSEFYESLSAIKENDANTSSKTLKPICIYPSIENVRTSYEGYAAGFSLPYSKSTADRQTYLNDFFHSWKAENICRTRASPHIKTYARFSNDFSKLYWFLLSSSNLSKAAWGSFEKNKTQLFIRSYEIGVLFLPEFFFNDESKSYFDLKIIRNFLVPYDLPPTKYDKNDKPYCSDDLNSFTKPDVNNRLSSLEYL